MSKRSWKIFISYSQDDSKFAHSLANALGARGAAIFADKEDINLGDSWATEVRRNIEKSNAVVLIVPSEQVARRNYIWFEVGAAKALGKPILAVLPPGKNPSRVREATNIADMLVLDADSRSIESVADTLFQSVSGAEHSELATM